MKNPFSVDNVKMSSPKEESSVQDEENMDKEQSPGEDSMADKGAKVAKAEVITPDDPDDPPAEDGDAPESAEQDAAQAVVHAEVVTPDDPPGDEEEDASESGANPDRKPDLVVALPTEPLPRDAAAVKPGVSAPAAVALALPSLPTNPLPRATVESDLAIPASAGSKRKTPHVLRQDFHSTAQPPAKKAATAAAGAAAVSNTKPK